MILCLYDFWSVIPLILSFPAFFRDSKIFGYTKVVGILSWENFEIEGSFVGYEIAEMVLKYQENK